MSEIHFDIDDVIQYEGNIYTVSGVIHDDERLFFEFPL